MKLALDAAAGDYGLGPNIEAAIYAANAWGLEILLAGPRSGIEKELSARSIAPGDPRFEILDAPDLVSMSEEAAAACRAKPRSSIMAAAEAVAAGRAAGLVSAGHSGASMVAALWHIKRIPGVLRPAIAVTLPTSRGLSILLDAGANADCKPWHLLQFAAMGAVYARQSLGIARPTVGILTIGEEEGKGNELVKEAVPLLKCSGLNFVGSVEGRDVPAGKADVVVCDGFVGNIAVKLMEGTVTAVLTRLKSEVLEKLRYKIAGLILRGPLGRLKKRLSYDEYGGAPLLGVDGIAVICHGSSNAKAIANALKLAKELAEAGINARITEALGEAALEPVKAQ